MMDLDNITEVLRPATVVDVKEWQAGYAWMAGGTWLNIDDVDANRTLASLISERSRKYQWNERK